MQLLRVVGPRLLFPLEDAGGHAQLFDAAPAVLDRRRRRRQAQPDPGTGRVEQADGLVGQLAARNIAAGELHRVDDRIGQNADLVMLFEGLDQSPHHLDGDVDLRFLDLHDLEPAGQGRILFEVLLVFGPRRGGDGADFAAGQCRFQEVGRVALPGTAPRADHLVGFVDEQDDGRGGRLDLFDDRFEPILEFSFDAGAGLQQSQDRGCGSTRCGSTVGRLPPRRAGQSLPRRPSCPRPPLRSGSDYSVAGGSGYRSPGEFPGRVPARDRSVLAGLVGSDRS